MRTLEEIEEYISINSTGIEQPYCLYFKDLDDLVPENIIKKIQQYLTEQLYWTDFHINEGHSSFFCEECLNEIIDDILNKFRRKLKKHWNKEKILDYVNYKIFTTDKYFKKYPQFKKNHIEFHYNTEKKLKNELRDRLTYPLYSMESDSRENCSLCGCLLNIYPICTEFIEEELQCILDYGKISQDAINFLSLLTGYKDDVKIVRLMDKIVSIHEIENKKT